MNLACRNVAINYPKSLLFLPRFLSVHLLLVTAFSVLPSKPSFEAVRFPNQSTKEVWCATNGLFWAEILMP